MSNQSVEYDHTCPFEHAASVPCLDATAAVAAAKEREARRRRIRSAAAQEVASWPESLRQRLRRDFGRAADEAAFISNRGRISTPPGQTGGAS